MHCFVFTDGNVVEAHKVFSWLGSVVGIPFLAEGLLRHNGHTNPALGLRFGPVVFLCLYRFLPREVKSGGQLVLTGVATVMSLISSSVATNMYGVIYSVCTLVLGAIGTDGYVLNVPRVDFFHYFLAAQLYVYLLALHHI